MLINDIIVEIESKFERSSITLGHYKYMHKY